ncbi:hypothetical protein ABT294_48310 [Nonomuraea sp. NPDC000554]|uniref:hypothetical protein n=1 Tax=Nonomuraea sp. NPDC000554 TaxID=3154259 RepID=UPI003331D588
MARRASRDLGTATTPSPFRFNGGDGVDPVLTAYQRAAPDSLGGRFTMNYTTLAAAAVCARDLNA